MAKRRRSANLGGLAALAALGYMLTKGERNNAPVEFRGSDSKNDPNAYKGGSGYADLGGYSDMAMPLPEDDAPQGARVLTPAEREGMRISEGERVAQEVAQRREIAQMMDAGHFNRARPPAGPATAGSASSAGPARPNYNAIAARQNAELRARQAAPDSSEHVFSGPMNPRTTEGYDPRLAGLSSAAVGQGEAAAVRRATPPPLQQQLTRLTLGTPTDRAPGVPSIHAGPEAWQAFRAQQAQERNAQPATLQGSPRNIVQQMREKDKAVLAAVRRRQEEEEAARELARQVAEARAAERKRESDRMIERGRQTNPYYGRTVEERSKSMRAEGGAIKAKAKPKKMASGGMTSASKRGDGIASKGKTKCKMY